MRILVTGGTGVLGRAALPLLASAGHVAIAPGHRELDLFDTEAVAGALGDRIDAVIHLASRIPSLSALDDASAWEENDRLRTEGARLLVDEALAAGVATYVQATNALLYPAGDRVDEDTPLGDVPASMLSGLVAERETARFAAAGRRGVVLRFGLLDGPGTGYDEPKRVFGASLGVADAGAALVAALDVPSGVYNVTRDGERVSSARFKSATSWRPVQ